MMIDPKAVQAELDAARQARLEAELACDDVEELAAAIRHSHRAFIRRMAVGAAFRRTPYCVKLACPDLRLDCVPDHGGDVRAAEALDDADAGRRGDVDLGKIAVDHVDARKQQATRP
jgi:hypothetical protein